MSAEYHSVAPPVLDDDEFQTKRLDSIYSYLWLAGLPRKHIRRLHRHKILGRDVVVSDDISLHLVSRGGKTIFIKPFPSFLRSDLASQTERHALGFISTYYSMIISESDHHLAKELHLLPESLSSWDAWSEFRREIETKLIALQPENGAPLRFSNRFDYGELRLDRLNLIMALRHGKFATGYERLDPTYGSYFEPFVTVTTVVAFAFLAIALSAFQVAMVHPTSPTVTTVGYWFSVTVLCLLVALMLLPFTWYIVLFIDNLLFALRNGRG
ncbi:hypothetical protein BJV78DRAFT_1184382 [Lactifluus subvellereus]|nr:hypothetical protein BJV78DRAFT_1184382 [Lactifluus subvellereus]